MTINKFANFDSISSSWKIANMHQPATIIWFGDDQERTVTPAPFFRTCLYPVTKRRVTLDTKHEVRFGTSGYSCTLGITRECSYFDDCWRGWNGTRRPLLGRSEVVQGKGDRDCNCWVHWKPLT
jgi:hypothetical protein